MLARDEIDFGPRLGGTIEVDASYSDAVFKDAINDPIIAAGAYTIMNARLALFDDSHDREIAVWARDLSDERYVVQGQGLNTGLGAGNRNYNAPRTYGVMFTYRWQ